MTHKKVTGDSVQKKKDEAFASSFLKKQFYLFICTVPQC
jgi:hypothetical protein